MNLRVITTSIIASVAVIGTAVGSVLTFNGANTEELSAEQSTVAVVELDGGNNVNMPHSKIAAYSAFSDITLPDLNKPYFERLLSSDIAVSNDAEPTAGETTSVTTAKKTEATRRETSRTTQKETSRTTATAQPEQPTTTAPQNVSEISVLRLINSDNPLPKNFVPKTAKMNGQYVGQTIYPHLKEMFEDAKKDGVQMYVRSGYRSYASQEAVLNSYINQYRNQGYSYEKARQLALRWASLPGCSEHQSGLAVDINATGGSSSKTVYAWLAENAYKYGFILRYPEGKENITGIDYEPWHYRFVGVGTAEKIKKSGLCLEEYLR